MYPGACKVDVQGVSLSAASSVDVHVQGVSLFSACCMDLRGVSIYTIISVDVQGCIHLRRYQCGRARCISVMSYISRADKLGVSLSTTSRIDVQNCKSRTSGTRDTATLLVRVNVMRAGGRAPPTLTSQD